MIKRKTPSWLRGVNTIWEGSYFLGTKPKLDKDDLIRTARKRTGLCDLGSDFNDEPLERLLWSINEEARLNPLGRFITRERFIGLVCVRLRAENFFKRYPAILEQELYPSWIIIGLQRTGTTKLQRLLAADPDHRVIPSWEVINPIPLDPEYFEKHPPVNRKNSSSLHTRPGGAGTASVAFRTPDPARLKLANTAVNALRYLSPGFFAIHPIDALQPEEDILMLDVSFLSTTPEAMMHVPSYASWLEKTDQSEAYAYGAKLLRLLQWVHPGQRWILKTPHHLEFPDLIVKFYGNAHFLWPHRRIYESVPSYLNMVTHNRMIFSSHVSEKQVAEHWVRKTGYMLDKALKYRNIGNNDRLFTDIRYQDLVADSVGQLEKIYQSDGGLTPELVTAFRKHEAENPRHKHGTHHYSLDDFGLTEADIDRYTLNYQHFISEKLTLTAEP